tara:strand:- start:14087 stop:14428 length:342 start_codon:yes stop_codon:yes gene_type:complete
MAKPKWKIPFRKIDGSLARTSIHPGSRFAEQYEWKEPFEFSAIMMYDGYVRNRNGTTRFSFVDVATKHRYSMSVKDFDFLMMTGKIKGIIAQGLWGFRKSGRVITIKYVGEVN